jgi:SAM-dependent methyltransferase
VALVGRVAACGSVLRASGIDGHSILQPYKIPTELLVLKYYATSIDRSTKLSTNEVNVIQDAVTEEKEARIGFGPCRYCGAPLRKTFVDLGMSPLCETYIERDRLNHMEPFYPLHAYLCEECFLVQLDEYVAPEDIYRDYPYFSSYSDSWVEHARQYTEAVIRRFGLGANTRVVEIASNDGYLLQHFVTRGIPVLGIEPAANVAKVAIGKGIDTMVGFFGSKTARAIVEEYGHADLLLGNNVLAHVPDLNDFVSGMKTVLAPNGVITMEFPHLYRLMESNQFDTIYHEHFSYFSFVTVEQVFATHGITLFDVEEIGTHGGSLRIYGQHSEYQGRPLADRVERLRLQEIAEGFETLEKYAEFEESVKETKRQLLEFLISARRAGKIIVGYGACGKGNTLLNYCGIRQDFLDFTVDRSPHKQGKYTPGTRIPIYHPDRIKEVRPDYVLILPWNLKEEIMKSIGFIRDWGGQFVVPIPEVTVC